MEEITLTTNQIMKAFENWINKVNLEDAIDPDDAEGMYNMFLDCIEK